MKMHLYMGDKNNRRRYVGKHRKAACHIIRLITDKSIRYYHLHICIPKNKIVNIHSSYVQKVIHYKLPVFFKIAQHFPIVVAVALKIPLYKRIFQHCDQENACQHSSPHHTLQGIK